MKKLSNTGVNNLIPDYSFNSTALNLTFPLSSATMPTIRSSFTMVNYNMSPFLGATLLNQSLLTNTTVYFAYRDSLGDYLNSSFIGGNIVMNFSYPLSKVNKAKGTVTCAYASMNDIFWKNDSCVTKLYYGKDMI